MKKKVLIWLLAIVLIFGAAGTACYFCRDTIKGWFGGNDKVNTYDYGAELKVLQAQIVANNNEILAAQQEINTNQAYINEKQADTNTETAQEIAVLEAKNEALQNRIATLEAENQMLEEQIVELQNKIQNADLIISRTQVTAKLYKDDASATTNTNFNVINYQSGAKVINGRFSYGNISANAYTYLYIEFPDNYFNDLNYIVLATPIIYPGGQSNKSITFYVDSINQKKFCFNIYNKSSEQITNLQFNILIYDNASWGAQGGAA